MARKNKMKNFLVGYWWVLIILIVLVLLVATSMCSVEESAIFGTTNDTDGGFIGTGGGGGGGGGAPSGPCPDPEPNCIDCDAKWKGVSPFGKLFTRKIDASFDSGSLLASDVSVGSARIVPMFGFGYWECDDVCPDPGDNCVLNPVDTVPSGGYTDISEPPDCKCLPKLPGECNWYDANYGEGSDNLQCGGSCPTGLTCQSWTVEHVGIDMCDCLKGPQSEICGFHKPDDLLTSFEVSWQNAKNCWGWCDDEGDVCTYWKDQNGNPRCDCLEEEPEVVDPTETDCWDVRLDSKTDFWRCFLARCDNNEECMFDPETISCFCQDPEVCAWHITQEILVKAREIYERSGMEAVKQWLMDNIDMLCHGGCDNPKEECIVYKDNYGLFKCDCVIQGDDFDNDGLPDSCPVEGGVCVVRSTVSKIGSNLILTKI